MKLLKTLFASLYAAVPLMIIYAILIGVATFIENDYGTNTAKALIYNTWFFNILHLWILVCLVGVIIRYKLLQQKKYASFVLHLSFIVIIIGAGVTRFFGEEGIMHIREGESSSSYTSLENSLNILVVDGDKKYNLYIPTNINYATSKKLNEKVIFGDKYFVIKSNSIDKMNDIKTDTTSILNGVILYNDMEYPLTLIGGSSNAQDSVVDLNGAKVILNWGPRMVHLPFSLYLNDFILDRYPGSMSPSSYEAKVTLIDEEKNIEMPYDIYMNHTLDYRGFRFFQSSYDEDEKGTILSVNNDPGKLPTYFGYFLLIVGSIWVIFAKSGRFRKLGRFLKSQSIYSFILLALLLANAPLYATEQIPESNTESTLNDIPQENILKTLQLLRDNSKEQARLFGELQVQDYGGRIKPVDTLAGELVHKMTKKDNFLGLSNTQVILGMILYANEWRSIKVIKISTPQLREIIGVDVNEDYISFNDLFTQEGEYKLTNYVEEANRKKPADRGTFDKDLLNVDERVNIAYGIFTAQFLKIFPIPNNGEMWLSPIDIMTFGSDAISIKVQTMLQNYFSGFDEGLLDNNWEQATKALQDIKNYQKEYSNPDIYLSEDKLKAEIFLNHTNLFKQLILPYIFVGLIMFIIVFICIFKHNAKLLKVLKFLYFISAFIVLLHLIALILRWYVSGHAPWSNAYESMLYIAFTSGIAGVVFFRKSYLAISTSMFLAGISLFVANLGFMDPQIGNLVPVLKSYWLNIHVSVITASYGFLGLCFLLGIITLILIIIRNNKNEKIDSTINSITAINEMSMILGLVLLCVGNFLGGIWANESWGRYWGWDPKETWSLVTIGVYAIILHLRFIFKKNLQYIFASSSVVGFFSVLMTYFGVNYYLSGLHSYAAGDPLPIPTFLYVMVVGVILLIVVAFFKRNMEYIKI
ncbi:cytochrome C biogenesis protein [Helicobacter sp. 16-1353]|uniref:cytochrome c biogenesis protein CcsA n=1 Tax=Helicobacter sp. 16-1353 TaxID=2004996 RepID=UPI000DCC5655|nr:cytochrome c biogenesis protein CcsA [Helicobacter sp. 16-1353]RAX54686.1 cytochrome C biogenesis protein [Helicobacter sp. 16-1353]